ncbi:MAG: 50S ribosomal protein L25 [Candidatus Nealsonbacteria bacterium CG_4_8_14_3_um_filter_39_7]|nr:MAG: 50S ribosomal protein L25 [Candidatus Nealsonbacteria bacterium CG_4_8_14_3_um_filter_39_7]
MLKISAQIRDKGDKDLSALKKEGFLPGVLYGPKIGNKNIKIGVKEFATVYKGAGESSLISLIVPDQGGKEEKFSVLIHQVDFHPLNGEIIHADFYQPNLTEKVTTKVPLVFEGISLAVKDLAGTLIKNIQEIEVRALPQDLPHELVVNIEPLKTFNEEILVKNLIIPANVEVLKSPEENVALVLPPKDIEAELKAPIEEKVEDVEKVEKKKEEEVAEVEEKKEKEEKGGEKKEHK